MLFTLISLLAVLSAGQQSQSLGAAEGLRPPPATAPEVESDAVSAPRQICRNVPVTGSRFPIRQCRNVRETDTERVEAREMLRRMQGARTPPVG